MKNRDREIEGSDKWGSYWALSGNCLSKLPNGCLLNHSFPDFWTFQNKNKTKQSPFIREGHRNTQDLMCLVSPARVDKGVMGSLTWEQHQGWLYIPHSTGVGTCYARASWWSSLSSGATCDFQVTLPPRNRVFEVVPQWGWVVKLWGIASTCTF